jgi:hypothetical protein
LIAGAAWERGKSPKKNVLKKLLDTFFNPFASAEDVYMPKALSAPAEGGFAWHNRWLPVVFGNPRYKDRHARALFRAGELAVGYGSAAYLVRAALQKIQAKKGGEDAAKIEAYLNSRFPVLSPDPSLQDYTREQRLRQQGLEVLDDKQALDFSDFVPSFTRPNEYWLALNFVAALGASGAAITLYDRLQKKKEERRTSSELSSARQKLDKLYYDEFLRTRGLESKEAGGPFATAKSVYILYAVATGALAYASARRYFQYSDPARKQLKELKDVAREQGKLRRAPVMLSEFFPEEEGSVAAKSPGSLAQTPVKPTRVPPEEIEELLRRTEIERG